MITNFASHKYTGPEFEGLHRLFSNASQLNYNGDAMSDIVHRINSLWVLKWFKMLKPIHHLVQCPHIVNTLAPTQNGCCFADDIFKYIFLNESHCILIRISLFSLKIQFHYINYDYINQWWSSSLTHMCVARHKWDNQTHKEQISLKYELIFIDDNTFEGVTYMPFCLLLTHWPLGDFYSILSR